MNAKLRRKLNKSQVLEILERNAALYRDDEAFLEYLVNLTLYLIEYEYNWAESGCEPPKPRDIEKSQQVTPNANIESALSARP